MAGTTVAARHQRQRDRAGLFSRPRWLRLDQDAAAQMAPMKRGGGPEDLKGVRALVTSDACAFCRPDAAVRRWGHGDL